MTARKQNYVAMALFIGGVIVIGILAANLNSAFALLIMPVGIAYGVWTFAFACPKCSAPYLVEMKGFMVVPRTFPDKCRNCGWPVD